MKIRIIEILTGLLLVAVIFCPSAAFAVSYTPAPLYHRQEAGEVAARGDTVYLFHSGTAEVRRTIRSGNVLTVYRISTSCKTTEEGKIRIVAYIGHTYLKGEVVEGEIKPGDIARKGAVSCLVISAGMCGQSQ
jgi:hypothetical protein